MPIKNNRLLKTIFKEPVDATPIWIMRQAGRYLPEYRALREKAGSFMNLCQTPELACEATLQPLRRYDLDAAIVFSDILTIPDAMGLGLRLIESRGPVFEKSIRTEQAVNQLSVPSQEKLNYVYETIKLIKHELADSVPLIGFSGSPWTLAAYMVEGQSNPGFPELMKMCAQDPFLLHRLLDLLATAVAEHLNAQIKAGADVVMIFDTWGNLLGTENYQEFSLHYTKLAIDRLTRNYNDKRVPVIFFTRGGAARLEIMADSGCDVVGLDWEADMSAARAKIGGKVALQGNMNPAHLLANPETILHEVKSILSGYGRGSGHVFNLGHGITPDVPPEHVKILVDAVHEMSQEFHAA